MDKYYYIQKLDVVDNKTEVIGFFKKLKHAKDYLAKIEMEYTGFHGYGYDPLHNCDQRTLIVGQMSDNNGEIGPDEPDNPEFIFWISGVLIDSEYTSEYLSKITFID